MQPEADLATLDPQPRRRRRIDVVAIGVPTAAAAVVAFWNLGRPGMMGTEAVTYWVSQRSPGVMMHVLHHVDVVHGTYYALMHVLFGVFGGGTFVLRLPSALGMTAAVALTGLLAQRLTGSNRAAFLSAAALATVPVLANYAQTGRSYALDVAVVAATTLLLLRCLDDGARHRTWWAYTASLTACVYLHEFTLLLAAAHAVTLVWSRMPVRALLRWSAHAAVAVLASLPLLIFSTAQAGQVAYLRRPDLRTVVAVVRLLLGPSTAVLLVSAALIGLAVGADVLDRRRGVTVARLALPLFVVPSALLIGESVVGHPYFGGIRYVLFSVVGAALLIGAGLHQLLELLLRKRFRVVAAGLGAALLLGLFLAQLPLQIRQHSARGEIQNLIGVASYLHAHARPGDAVVYAPRSLLAVQLAYPGDVRALTDIDQARSPAASGTLYGTQVDPRMRRLRVEAHTRLWVVAVATGQPPQVGVFATRHGFHLASDVAFRGASVLLYVAPHATTG